MSKPRIIVEAVLAGKSQREVAGLYGISQPRVSQLLAAYRAGAGKRWNPDRCGPAPTRTPPDRGSRTGLGATHHAAR
jgi:hypothetical protein